MALPQVTIQVVNGNGRTSPNEDSISGLVLGAVNVSGGFQKGTAYELNSLAAAEDLGLTAAYDLANGIAVHHHIKRFFMRAPGAKLWVLGVDQGTTLSQMANKTLTYGKYLIVQAGGKIRQMGFVLNPDMGSYSPTITAGIDASVTAAVPVAQQLADEQLTLKRPLVCLIEGRELTGAVGSVVDMRTKASPNVGVVLAQDKDFADSDAAFENTAAVGDVLGLMASAQVNLSLGWVGGFPLTNVAEGAFNVAALSSNSTVESYSDADLGTLYDKGFIVPRTVVGKPGYFLAGSPSCTAATSDFAFLEDTRTVNKVVRLINLAYADYINASVLVNPDGTMQGQEVANFEAVGEQALAPMLQAAELSNANVVVDPLQDVVSTGEVETQVGLTQVGVSRQLRFKIGYGLVNTQTA